MNIWTGRAYYIPYDVLIHTDHLTEWISRPWEQDYQVQNPGPDLFHWWGANNLRRNGLLPSPYRKGLTWGASQQSTTMFKTSSRQTNPKDQNWLQDEVTNPCIDNVFGKHVSWLSINRSSILFVLVSWWKGHIWRAQSQIVKSLLPQIFLRHPVTTYQPTFTTYTNST